MYRLAEIRGMTVDPFRVLEHTTNEPQFAEHAILPRTGSCDVRFSYLSDR